MAFESSRFEELRFITISPYGGLDSAAVRQENKKPECFGLWFLLSSGEWIRTTDLQVMSLTSCLCSTPQ